jgi:glycine oxidase
MPHPDVIIVGGGVVGAACARALGRAKYSVTLIEAGSKSGTASKAAAGMLAALAEAGPEDPMLGLSVRARDFYLELAPDLLDETGVDIGLWTEGVFQAAFSDEEVTRRRSEVAWQRQSGFTSEWLSAEEVRANVPGISQEVLGAAFAPEDGALEPLSLLEALIKSAEAHGVTVLRGEEVLKLKVRDDRIEGAQTTEGARPAGAVVLAAGAWSGRLSGLPRPLSVEPIRGQIAVLDWPPDQPRTVIYGAGGYVVQRSGEAIVGSTMEHSGFDDSVTEDGLAAVRLAASRIYPALQGVTVKRAWAGLRPQTPDGRPIIGPDPTISGLWYATGHGRNGILLAAYTGDLLARLHSGDPIEHDLSCVTPGRFWNW